MDDAAAARRALAAAKLAAARARREMRAQGATEGEGGRGARLEQAAGPAKEAGAPARVRANKLPPPFGVARGRPVAGDGAAAARVRDLEDSRAREAAAERERAAAREAAAREDEARRRRRKEEADKEARRQRRAQEARRRERERAARAADALPLDVLPLVLERLPWHALLAAAGVSTLWRRGAEMAAAREVTGRSCGLGPAESAKAAEEASLAKTLERLKRKYETGVARAQSEARAYATRAEGAIKARKAAVAAKEYRKAAVRLSSEVPCNKMSRRYLRQAERLERSAETQRRLEDAKKRMFNGGVDMSFGHGISGALDAVADGGLGGAEYD